VNDMLRWLAHMDAPTVGTAATWEMMKSPLTLTHGTSTGYGFGLMVNRYRGVETLGHAGNNSGANAQTIKVPSVGLDVVVLVNRSDVSSRTLANQILDVCLTGLEPVSASDTKSRITGTFRSPASGRVIQLFVRDGQQIALIDGFPVDYVSGSDGVLRPAPIWSFFKQEIVPVGDAIRFNDAGNLDELIAVQPARKIDVGALAGVYHSNTTGIQLTISGTGEEGELHAVCKFGMKTYPLKCLAAGIWRAAPHCMAFDGGIVCPDEDARALRFTTGRNLSLKFERVVQ
jgi:D-aminopeptidase